MADDAKATDNPTTNHHQENQKRAAVGKQSGSRQLGEWTMMTMMRRDPQRQTGRASATATTTSASSALRPPLPSPSLSLDGRRQQRRPLALEDQLEILHHNFAAANRPAPLPVTMTTTMTASDGAGVVDRCRCLGGVNDDGNATIHDGGDNDDTLEDQKATKELTTDNTRVTRCVGGRRPTTQSLMNTGRRARTKRAADKRKQQPTIGR